MRYPSRLGLVEQDGVLHYRKQIPDPELRQWLPAPHTGKSAIQRSLGESSWNKAAERKRDAVAVEFNDIVDAAKAAMQAGHRAISDPRFNDAVVLRAVQQLAGELPGGMAAVMDRIINGLVPRPKVEFPRETPAPGGDVSFGDLIDNWALHR
jgi:hypothetical protein